MYAALRQLIDLDVKGREGFGRYFAAYSCGGSHGFDRPAGLSKTIVSINEEKA